MSGLIIVDSNLWIADGDGFSKSKGYEKTYRKYGTLCYTSTIYDEVLAYYANNSKFIHASPVTLESFVGDIFERRVAKKLDSQSNTSSIVAAIAGRLKATNYDTSKYANDIEIAADAISWKSSVASEDKIFQVIQFIAPKDFKVETHISPLSRGHKNELRRLARKNGVSIDTPLLLE